MGTFRPPLAATRVIKKSNPNPTTGDTPAPDSQQRQSLQPEHKHHQEEAFSKQEEQNGYDGQVGESRLFSTTSTMPRESASIPSQRHKNKNHRTRQQVLLDAKRKRESSPTPVAPHHPRRQRNRKGASHFYVTPIYGTADKEVDTHSGYNDSDNTCSSVHTQSFTTPVIIGHIVSKKRPREQDPDPSTCSIESTGSFEEQRPTHRRVLMANNQFTSSAFLPITAIPPVLAPVSVPAALRPALNGLTSQAPAPGRKTPHLVYSKGMESWNDSDILADVDPNFDVGTDADDSAMEGSIFSSKYTYHMQDSSAGQEDEDDNQDNSSGTDEVSSDEEQSHGDAHDWGQDSNDGSQQDDDNGSDNNNNSEDKDGNDKDNEDQDDKDENDNDQNDENQDDENQTEDEAEDEGESDDENKSMSTDANDNSSSPDSPSPSKGVKDKARWVSSPSPPFPTSGDSADQIDDSRATQIKSDEALAHSLHQQWNRTIAGHPTVAHNLSVAGTSSIVASGSGSSSRASVTPWFGVSSSSNVVSGSRSHQTPNVAGTFDSSTSSVFAAASSSSAAPAPGYSSSYAATIGSHNTATGSPTPSNPPSSPRQSPIIPATQAHASGSQSGRKQAHNSSGQSGSKQSHVVPLQIQPSANTGASHASMSRSSSQQSSHSGSGSASASASGSPGPSLSPQSHLRDSYFTGFSDGRLHGYITARRHARGAQTGLVALDLANLSGSNTTDTPSAFSPPQLHTLISGQLLDVVESSWSEYDRLHAAARLDPSLQPPPRMYGFGIIPGQGFGYGEIIGPGLIRALPDFSRPHSATLLQGQNLAYGSATPVSASIQVPVPVPVSAAPLPGPTSGSTGASSVINALHAQQQQIALTPTPSPSPSLSPSPSPTPSPSPSLGPAPRPGVAPGATPPASLASTVLVTVQSAAPAPCTITVITPAPAPVVPPALIPVQMPAVLNPMPPVAIQVVFPIQAAQVQNQAGGEQQCTAIARTTGLRCKRLARANGRCYQH
ncbi:hypothetical protein BG011_007502 [Mortierella polycephala]|uniref:Uncharacterized protein n=1 Tax=Mortierella polycephala TaxID=41804 RepID=A0A9P6PQ08_9FUNG|nr:hypothetical protein BG011_007502 [Mortierella polycephala]